MREEIGKFINLIDVQPFQGIKVHCFPVSDYLFVRMWITGWEVVLHERGDRLHYRGEKLETA